MKIWDSPAGDCGVLSRCFFADCSRSRNPIFHGRVIRAHHSGCTCHLRHQRSQNLGIPCAINLHQEKILPTDDVCPEVQSASLAGARSISTTSRSWRQDANDMNRVNADDQRIPVCTSNHDCKIREGILYLLTRFSSTRGSEVNNVRSMKFESRSTSLISAFCEFTGSSCELGIT